MKIPEAFAVYLPRPSVERLKIPPHMIDVQRPQRKINTQDNGTVAFSILMIPRSILRVVVTSPVKIAATMRIIPTVETVII